MRILLAEDERSLSRAVIALLEKNNYSADAVYDGQEALEYLEVGNYDALILDLMMPKMDRLTVLRTLREQGNPIPVLILTAKSEVDDKVLGLDTGANDYLTKPFSTQELMARIRAMTRSQTGGKVTSRLTFGNITLDQAVHRDICVHVAAYVLDGTLLSTGRSKRQRLIQRFYVDGITAIGSGGMVFTANRSQR